MQTTAEHTITEYTVTPEIAAYIRERREELGWAQMDINDRLGMSDSFVSQLERGISTESHHLPTILAWLEAGELPPLPGPKPVGACETCTILLYEADELPEGAASIQVVTFGRYCRECAAEGNDG